MLASLDDDDTRGVLVGGIQKDIERLWNDRRRYAQQGRCTRGEPAVTERARHLGSFPPVRRQLVDCNALEVNVIRCFDFQHAVPKWQVLNVDFEVNQDLEQRGGRILRAIHEAPAP